MTLNRIAKTDLADLDIVDAYELVSDGHSTNSIYLDTTVVSTTSSTKTVVVNLAADGQGILYSYDHPVEAGDILWLSGTSGGAADGYYTVATIIDDTSLTVNETIADSTSGNAQFRYEAGAIKVGIDSRLFGYSSSNNVQSVLSDLNSYLLGLSLSGDVTGPLGSNTVINIHGSPVTTIGAANTVLGTTDGSNIIYFQVTNAQVSSSAAIAVSKLAAGTDGYYLNTTSGVPTWKSLATDSLLGRDTAGTGGLETITLDTTLEFTGSQVIRRAALTGDVTASAGSNATAIGANKVLDTMIRQSTALSVIGRSANSTGNVADIAGTNNQVLRISGSVLGFGAIDLGTAQVTASADISANTHKIISVVDPSNPQDVATKNYVDGYGYSTLTILGDVTGTLAATTVVQLQNRALSSSAPTDGYAIIWDSGSSTWVTTGHILDMGANAIKFGGASSTTGQIRLPNNQGIFGRTTLATDARIISLDASNRVIVGSTTDAAAVFLEAKSTGFFNFIIDTTTEYSFTDTNTQFGVIAPNTLTFGSAASTAGLIRLPNNNSISSRNNAGSGNVPMLSVNTTDDIVLGSVPVKNETPSTDGYVWTYVSANSRMELKPTGIITLAGDVTGTLAANTVVKLQNRTLSNSAPTDGYVITWDAGSSTWVTTGHDILLGTYGFAGSSIVISPNSTGATNSTVISLNTANYAGLTSAYRAVSLTTTGTYSHVAGSYSNTSMIRIRQPTIAGDSATAAFTGVQSMFAIQGPPTQGTNATLSNPVEIWLEASGGAIAIGAGAMPTTGNLRFGFVAQASGGVKGITGIANDGSTQESLLSWNTVTNSLRLGGNTANDLTKLLFKTGGTGILFSSASDEYSFNETRADWGSNTLINVANIQFPGSGVSTMTDGYLRFPSGTVLAQSKTAAAVEVHIVRWDNTDKLFFGDSVASGVLATIMSVATGGAHSWRINNSEIGKMDGTKLDLESQVLTFTGVGNPASDGYIRFPKNGHFIDVRRSDNGANVVLLSGDNSDNFTFGDNNVTSFTYNIGTGGTHKFQVNATDEYIFSSSIANFKDNPLEFGTTPSATGWIRVPAATGYVIGARNYDNSGDQGVIYVGGDGSTFQDLLIGDSGTKGNFTLYLQAKGQSVVQLAGNNEYIFTTSSLNLGDNVLLFGTNPAGGGLIRFPKSPSGTTQLISARNAANSADVGIILLDTSDNIQFGEPTNTAGAAYVVKSGGTHSFYVAATLEYLFSGTLADFKDNSISFGSTPSTAGTIRLSNNQSIATKTSSGGANISIINVDGNNDMYIADSNVRDVYVNSNSRDMYLLPGQDAWIQPVRDAYIKVGSGRTISFEVSTTVEYQFSSTVADFKDNKIQFGTTPSTTGLINVPKNSSIIYGRNTANTGDVPVLRLLDTDLIIVGGGTEGIAGMQLEVTSGPISLKIATNNIVVVDVNKVFVANSASAPTAGSATPTGGNQLYSEAGALKSFTSGGCFQDLSQTNGGTTGGTVRKIVRRENSVQTTNATTTVLDTVALPTGSVSVVEARVVGRQAGTNRAGYILRAVYTSEGAGPTTNLIGTVDQLAKESNSAWDSTLDSSGANARVLVTGVAATTIQWWVEWTISTYQP